MNSKSVLAALLGVIASGCGTLEHKTILIDPGANKERVLEIMGTPDDRQFQGSQEAWQYCVTGAGFGYHDYRVIWFKDGKVTGITSNKINIPGSSCMAGIGPVRWENAPDTTVEIRNR